MMTRQQDYTLDLEQFHGPLDLLLQLIVRSELEITEISIAGVADSYLAHINDLSHVDVDVAGEFLVIAATLVEIKSRRLAPPEAGDARASERLAPAGPVDAATELVQQLLAYKSYREAGDLLDQRRDEWLRRYPLGKAAIDRQALHDAAESDGRDLEDLGLYDLVEAFRKIAETVVFDRVGDHEVADEDTPIELHQADLVDQLERRASAGGAGPLSLREVFTGRKKTEAVGLFIALLELVRQRRIRVDPAGDGDVTLALRSPEEDTHTLPAEQPEDATEGTPRQGTWEDDHIFGGDDESEPDDED